MKILIKSNVMFDSKVLLKGETKEVPEPFASDFISRGLAASIEADEQEQAHEPVIEQATRQAGQIAQPEVQPITEQAPVKPKAGKKR